MDVHEMCNNVLFEQHIKRFILLCIKIHEPFQSEVRCNDICMM